MQLFTMKNIFIPLALVSLLTACGGGGGGGSDLAIGSGSPLLSGGSGDAGTPGDSGTPGDPGSEGPMDSASVLALGTGEGVNFMPNVMSLASSSISAQGQTTVTVNVVDLANNSALVTDSVTVSFTSTCVESGNASITSSTTILDGTAQAVYVDIDCASSDIITATISGTTAMATASLDVAPLTLGAISFVSADPTTISLQNLSSSSLQSDSTIVFEITDESGNPVSGQNVTFSIPGIESMGGVTFGPATDISDGNGLVSTTVNSGTVKTTLAVLATIDGTQLSTSSATISISTGVAHQESFSLSFSELNPPRAWNVDGVEVTVTVRVSDYYSNPVPNGGKVSFFAEGGQIDPDCTLSGDTGSCSVMWRSQSPRPSDGIARIMATIKGEEEQTVDANANGLYDPGEDSFVRLSEAFLDINENGICDFGELRLDANLNGTCDTDDTTAYKGVRCADENDCAGLTDVFLNSAIVMSSEVSAADIITADCSATDCPISAGINFLNFVIPDVNGNTPGLGTEIDASFEPSMGDEDVMSAATAVVPNTASRTGYGYQVVVVGDGSPSTGLLTLTVTNPGGLVSQRVYTVTEP